MTEQQKATELLRYAFEQTGDLPASIKLCVKLCDDVLAVLAGIQHSSNDWTSELSDSEKYAFEKWKYWMAVKTRIQSGNIDV